MRYNYQGLKRGPHQCPVCGRHTFPEYASYDYCYVCGWQDDPAQERKPDAGGLNYMSLNEARREWLEDVEPKISLNLAERARTGEKPPAQEEFLAELTDAYFATHSDEDMEKGKMLYASNIFTIIADWHYKSELTRFKAGVVNREDFCREGVRNAIADLFEIEEEVYPHSCPVCGQYYFSDYDSYDICPVCEWQDSAEQEEDPDYWNGANYASLREARRQWRVLLMTKVNFNLLAREKTKEKVPSYEEFRARVEDKFYRFNGSQGKEERKHYLAGEAAMEVIKLDYKWAAAKFQAGVINREEFLKEKTHETADILAFKFKVRRQ